MSDSPEVQVSIGEVVYNGDGERVGSVRGVDEDGFFVTTREGVEAMSVEHERAGHSFGEAELLWRCAECGAIGDIGDIPEACPDCDAEREALFYWIED
ncbi:MAG: hypothetical protein ABEH65_11810 [Halobacteriales archaeon]